MSLMVASILGIGIIKLFSGKQDASTEMCPVPFYGSNEYADAFAEAFANKNKK